MIVWWIKKDFRTADNAALTAAHAAARQRGCPLVAVWVDEPEAYAAPEFHPRRDRFVFDCLNDLESSLSQVNIPLWIARGRAVDVFAALIALGLRAVYSHEETGVLWTFRRDMSLKRMLRERHVEWTEFPTNGVVRGLKNRDHWHGVYQERMKGETLPSPSEKLLFAAESALHVKMEWPDAVEFFAWKSDKQADWARNFAAWKGTQQRGGERVAHALLERFLQPQIHRKYIASLAKPKEAQTFSSRLSPYLAFGCISSRQVLGRLTGNDRSLSAFRSRLAWRCHFIQKLENFPAMEEREQNAALRDLRPVMSADEFERWHAGQTGFPLVDACLRSVHATGFLNFRMRAMLMSFATHLMWRDWRHPAWDLAQAFLDFEPGIHFAQVQMQAAVTGNNQIRIYNPVKQSLENDPEARFIKEWIPELRSSPPEAIHAMESHPANYSAPMFDLRAAMAHSREKLFKRMSDSDVRTEARTVQKNLGSRGGFSRGWRKSSVGSKRRASKKETPSENAPLTLFDAVEDDASND